MSIQPPPIGTPMFLDVKTGIMSPAWYLWFVSNTAVAAIDTTDNSTTQSHMDHDPSGEIALLRRSVRDIQTQIAMQMLYDSEIMRLRKAIQDMRTELAMQCDYRAEIAGLRREINDIRTQFDIGA